MKIFISLDMEGCAGTYSWKQDDQKREEVRELMTRQLKWVIKGIQKSDKNDDVDEIVVADSHNCCDSLKYDISRIDNRIFLISGGSRPHSMMEGVQHCDVVFLVGYHAGMSAICASMDHTYSSSLIKVCINGKNMNETFINAAVAGYYNVPVALVIGDEALKQEVLVPDAMPWIEYVATKQAITRFSSKFYPYETVKQNTIAAVISALSGDVRTLPIYGFHGKTTVSVEYPSTDRADHAELLPYSKRVDGRTVEFSDDNFLTVFRTFLLMTSF
ncbi:MAG: M55 family metallopeptidase [Negativicutes bacterium]|jgi:D-amino peptidase